MTLLDKPDQKQPAGGLQPVVDGKASSGKIMASKSGGSTVRVLGLGLKRFISWGEFLGKPECPYIRRWVFDFKLFSIRIHHWLASDDQRHFHDHPWWFWTWVLWGGYTDRSPAGDSRMSRGKTAFREATHQHSVIVDKGGCWTLLITGPETRVWGFWVNGRFRKRNKYFYLFGHHPCETR